MMLKNRFLPLIMLVFVALGGLSGCLKKKAPPAQVMAKPHVTTTKAVTKTYVERFNFPARVDAISNVALKARVAGFLKDRKFEEGDIVKKGETLFVIEQEPFKAKVTEAKANLAKAVADAKNTKLNLNRALKLRESGNISIANVDAREAENSIAQALVMQTKAALNLAELNLSYTVIKAPFTGKIGLAAYSAGEYLPVNTTLATMVSYNPINALFSVAESEMLSMQKAGLFNDKDKKLNVSLTMSDNSTYPFDGKINFIDVMVDNSTDTLKLRAEFPNEEEKLVEGQFVSLLLEYEAPEKKIVIPQAAVMASMASKYVYVLDAQNKVINKPVVVGPEQGADIVILSGLEPDSRVIVDGIQKVRVGVEVIPDQNKAKLLKKTSAPAKVEKQATVTNKKTTKKAKTAKPAKKAKKELSAKEKAAQKRAEYKKARKARMLQRKVSKQNAEKKAPVVK